MFRIEDVEEEFSEDPETKKEEESIAEECFDLKLKNCQPKISLHALIGSSNHEG